jgi:HPt (histidine-containing phosphotransfer) domain-containing protein
MSGLLHYRSPQNSSAEVIQSLATTLEPARILFCGLILDRILAFEAFRKQAASDQDADRALDDIAGLAHKISGVAASLGYGKAGELAAALERAVVAPRIKGTTPAHFSAKIEPLLEALLVELETLLDE